MSVALYDRVECLRADMDEGRCSLSTGLNRKSVPHGDTTSKFTREGTHGFIHPRPSA